MCFVSEFLRCSKSYIKENHTNKNYTNEQSEKKHPSNNEHLKKHNDFFPGWSLWSPYFFPLEWAFLLRKVGPCAGKDAAGDADVGLAHRQGASRKNIGEGLTGDKKGIPSWELNI